MRRPFVWIIAAVAVAAYAVSSAAGEFELCSRTLIQGPARGVDFVKGGIILCTGGGLAVFSNDSTFESPVFLPIEGMPSNVVINGDFAYVAAPGGGLSAVDLSDVSHPRVTWRFPTALATCCARAGRTVVLASSASKLFIFDIEHPREPRLRETKELSVPAASLASDGERLAVIYPRKAEIFRALPDGALEKTSEVIASSDIKKALLTSGVLYLVTVKGKVQWSDVAGPGPQSRLRSFGERQIVDMAVSDTGAGGMLLTESDFVVPFEIERPAATGGAPSKPIFKIGKAFNIKSIPSARRSNAAQGSFLESNKPTGVFASEKRFALVSPMDGVRLYERAGAGTRFLGFFATRGFAINLIASRGLVYVANGYDGVRIGAVEKDGGVDWIGHLQTEEARDVAMSALCLVIADGEGGIKIADVADPRSPKLIGRLASPYYMSAVAVRGTRAYCAGGLGGAEIVDFADARRPRSVWRERFSEVRGITADSSFLYFTDGFKGFRIYSLEGERPAPLSLLGTPGWNCDCLVSGNRAYLAYGGGVVVADVSEKRSPRVLGSISIGTIARRLSLRGTTLFTAADTRGIAAIDVSNPKSPTIASLYQTADDGRGVYADEDFVYLASGSGGVYIFRYRN